MNSVSSQGTIKISIFVISVFFALSALACSAEKESNSLTVLRSLLPQFADLRIMAATDLANERERQAVKDSGNVFALQGDFNRDGVEDTAIVVTFTNPQNPDDRTALVMITERQGRPVVDFLFRPISSIIVLSRRSHPNPAWAKKGYEAVIAQFTAAPSDDYAVLYWENNAYRIKSGFDLISEVTK